MRLVIVDSYQSAVQNLDLQIERSWIAVLHYKYNSK